MTTAKNSTPVQPHHHYVRTMLAAFLGTLALLLVSVSILVVWVNRTLTDTTTYTQTVGPLLARPELQDFVATQVTNQLLQNASVSDVANQLLPADQIAGKTPDQLKALVTTAVHDKVAQALQSSQLQTAWRTTNQSVQAALVRQLDSKSATVTLDFTPLVNAALDDLQQTGLGPNKGDIVLPADKATVALKGKPLEAAQTGYQWLKTGAPVLVLVTLILMGLAVWVSVHHLKTLRRMLMGTGVTALVVAGLIALPRWVQLPNSDPAAGRLAAALAATLFHGLQVACLVLGIVCIGLALGTKLWERMRRA